MRIALALLFIVNVWAALASLPPSQDPPQGSNSDHGWLIDPDG
jgi:hypothetical protein